MDPVTPRCRVDLTLRSGAIAAIAIVVFALVVGSRLLDATVGRKVRVDTRTMRPVLKVTRTTPDPSAPDADRADEPPAS